MSAAKRLPVQVFQHYEPVADGALAERRFCPRCAGRCEPFADGGRVRPRCPACGLVQYVNPATGVASLVVEGRRALFGRYASGTPFAGKWSLPAGFVEYDEDFLTAARRETREETGLEIELSGILSVVTNYFSPALHTLVVVVVGRAVGGELRAGDDFEAVRWVPIEGPYPELASWGDRKALELFDRLGGRLIPVDPHFARE